MIEILDLLYRVVKKSVTWTTLSNHAVTGNRQGYSDADLEDTFIGYVTGQLGDEEEKAVILEFCGMARVLSSGFKCQTVIKSTLIGSFQDGAVRSLELLKEHASKVTSCGKNATCNLHIYRAQPTIADNDWLSVQSQPHWGLDRIDQKDEPLDSKFRYATSGKGVTVFIMDTVASLIGGLEYGVAKDAQLMAVQVLPCYGKGLSADLLKGLHWVKDNIDFYKPAIVSMSLHLQKGVDPGVEDLIEKITQKGVLVITSAGNGGFDACKFTPGRMKSTLTVGGSDLWSRVMPTSNTGECVDVYAPGSQLTAAKQNSDTAFDRSAQGTSMAAALATGVAAQLLERNPLLTPAQLIHLLVKSDSVNRKLTRDGKTGNFPLLNVDLSQPGTEQPPPVVEPGLAVNPSIIRPINLFKDTVKSYESFALQIANYGWSDLEWKGKAMGAGRQDPIWIKINPAKGTVKPQEKQSVAVEFDADSLPSGLYQGFVEISANDPKIDKIQLATEVRIFCRSLLSAGSNYSVALGEAKFLDARPDSWQPAQLPDEDDTLFVEAILKFSQPIVQLDQVDLQFNDGLIEEFFSVNDELCSTYQIRATLTKGDVWHGSNDFCIGILKNTIYSVSGKPFSPQTVCTPYDDKPEGRLYATHMTYDPEQGLITEDAGPVVVVAFSEPVEGFNDKNIQVSPGGLQGLTPIPGTDAMFYAQIDLPEDYYGSSIVKVNVEGVHDLTGNSVATAPSLTFRRIEKALVQHTAFRVADEL
ncbi:hypothetical protein BSKO_08677 [Bryopsis sp. KO-2023]|nr:hypothetical protein BSKO_08677 [Bryopsis sp. KO-2023]